MSLSGLYLSTTPVPIARTKASNTGKISVPGTIADRRPTTSAVAVSAVGVVVLEMEGSMMACIGASRARILRGVSLVWLGCVLVSCATIDATVTQYAGAPRFPATNPAAVEILRVEPVRPHERLGEIEVDASAEPAPPIEKVEDKLRAEAASLGADAVVVVVDRLQPVGAFVSGPWFGRDVDVIKGRKVVGVAIKYRP
jgi:hypothetical protein